MAAAAVYDALEKQTKPQNMLNGQMIAVCWFHWSPDQEVRLDDSQALLDHMQMYLLIHPHKKKHKTGTIWKHSQLHSCYCL